MPISAPMSRGGDRLAQGARDFARRVSGAVMWLMSDYEALAFVATVALMVALAVTVVW